MKYLFFFGLLILNSCNKLKTDNIVVKNFEKENLSIFFSHNINGETHPCGCRHFPLGGLPQVAGKIHELSKVNDIFYVDTGDTFFPSSTLPKAVSKSLTFAARNLAKGMDKMGLKFFVPGDQDFAAGVDFLKELVDSHKFEFLLSNLKDRQVFNHKEMAILKKGPHKIFMLGIVHPEAMLKYGELFTRPIDAVSKMLPQLKEQGYDSKNKMHRLIVLSHSGIDEDELLAKKFPQIDWIIGAHSQSFTRFPREEGDTKMVQVLSRNHYLGELNVTFTGEKKKDSFKIHEMRDEEAKKLSPNPFIDFIHDHKKKMSKVQIEEQSEGVDFSKLGKLNTNTSCLECHAQQEAHWKKTPHSLAYGTLLRVKEENNMDCLKCHAIGSNSPRGFTKASELAIFDKGIEKQKLVKHKESYWKDIQKVYKGVGSIRELPATKINSLRSKLDKIDDKYKVTHNFANVQCLSCHRPQDGDHPFDNTISESAIKKDKNSKYRPVCLSCHDHLQSPEWYQKDKRGLNTILDEAKFIKFLEKVGHPQK